MPPALRRRNETRAKLQTIANQYVEQPQTVRMAVLIGLSGAVERAMPVDSIEPAELAEALERFALELEFYPATRDSRAVCAWLVVPLALKPD